MNAGNDASTTSRTGGHRSRLHRNLAIGLTTLASAMLVAVVLPAPANANGDSLTNAGTSADGSQADNAQVAARCVRRQLIANGSFEWPYIAGNGTWALRSEGGIARWNTNDPQNQLEFWTNGMLNVNAKAGRQFLEINANGATNTVHQDFLTVPGTLLRWKVSYRARNSNPAATDYDLTGVRFGATPFQGDGAGFNAVTVANAGTNETRWRTASGTYWVPAGQWRTRLSLTAFVSSGPTGYGNLVDNVSVIGLRC